MSLRYRAAPDKGCNAKFQLALATRVERRNAKMHKLRKKRICSRVSLDSKAEEILTCLVARVNYHI
jgi:hypothetical protein